ncbi:hypothetical protein C7446_2705 [Kushneria sinocarnis]|uniref:ABC1 atypical kinase-like domain-containing protein n=1 Tax=Kushneria sinocarnis TaxID=595502 RepID=A0A420WTU2_9GAMM|nr:AarF/UbiB family protein [Kushneria sinocarnis]RKQ96845.1 hypothetical protein C7446_2705 [Kushneria sinocarnis]
MTRAGWSLVRPRWMRRRLEGPWRGSGSGWQWWLADPAGRRPAELFDDFLRQDSPQVVALRAKQTRSRWCYRIDDADTAERHWFAKRMVLPRHHRLGALLGVSHRWLGLTHGSAEFRHALALEQRTSLGVGMLALGEQLEFGLPTRQVLISSWLGDWPTLTSALLQADGTRRVQLLRALLETLRQLYRAGFCHLDLHPGNLLASPAPSGRGNCLPALKVIDCARVSLDADPDAAAAIHLGVLMHELNGKRGGIEPGLEQAGTRLLRAIIGHSRPAAERLLIMLLRYSTKKPFSRHTLLGRAPERLSLGRIEQTLEQMTGHRAAQASRPVMPSAALARAIAAALVSEA